MMPMINMIMMMVMVDYDGGRDDCGDDDDGKDADGNGGGDHGGDGVCDGDEMVMVRAFG